MMSFVTGAAAATCEQHSRLGVRVRPPLESRVAALISKLNRMNLHEFAYNDEPLRLGKEGERASGHIGRNKQRRGLE